MSETTPPIRARVFARPRLRILCEFSEQGARRSLVRWLPFQLLLFSVSSLFGSTVHVRVLDPLSGLISEASVHLMLRDGAFRQTVQADNGTALFVGLSKGVYVLYAEATGFTRSESVLFSLGEDETKEMELRIEIGVFKESVVVTGAASPQLHSEVTKTISVVTSEEIEIRDEHFLPDALRLVPGLRIQQLGGPGSFTSIKTRGLRNEDTAILIDGVRFRDAAAPQGDASGYLETFLATDVEQIEVLRGTGSAIYGTNAGGGVINVVTASGGGEPRGSVLFEGGGLGLLRTNAVLSGSYTDKLTYSVGASHLNVANGVDGNDSVRNTSTQGRLQLKLGPSSSVSFRLYTADAKLDLNESPEVMGASSSGVVEALPNVNFRPAADDPDSYRESSFRSFLVSYDHRVHENIGYTFRYHGLITKRSFLDGPAGVTAFEPATQFRSEYDAAIHTLSARTDFLLGRHLVHAGYEFEREGFVNRSFPDDLKAASVSDISQGGHNLYVQDQVSLFNGAMSLAGAFRAQMLSLGDVSLAPVENAPYKGVTIPTPEGSLTGEVSGAYTLGSKTKLRAHLGSGYRAPSLYERYGTSYSSFGYLAFGDPLLLPERTKTFDIGIEQSFFQNRVRSSAIYFRTRLSRIIIFDFSGAINPETDRFGRFGGYRTTDGGTTEGLELSGTFLSGRGLYMNMSYTFTDAEPPAGVTEEQTKAFIIPKHQFSLVATQKFGEKFGLSLDLLATGSYLAPIFDPMTFVNRVYRFSKTVKSDLSASFYLPKNVRLFGKIDNILNQEIYENGFRVPGRYALAGLALEF